MRFPKEKSFKIQFTSCVKTYTVLLQPILLSTYCTMLLQPLLFLGLAACVSCFHIPEGAADGVYSVYTDKETGEETHTLLKANPGPHVNRDIPVSDFVPSTKKRRQVPGDYGNSIGCGGYYLNVADTNSANGALDAQYVPFPILIVLTIRSATDTGYFRCGNGANVGGGLDFYSIAGCTVAYFCNQSEIQCGNFWCWASTYCYAFERQDAANAINGKCGGFGAGWDNFVWDGGYARAGQYGWESICDQGRNFCGRGTSGRRSVISE